MNEVIKIFKDSKYGYLATVDKGKPRVRPFGFMFAEDGKLYFCTNSTKEVYRQLKEIPFVEYSVTTKEMDMVRLNGEIIFSEDIEKKEKALNSSEIVKRAYKSADNPIFKVFYIEHGTAITTYFSGQPQKKVEF